MRVKILERARGEEGFTMATVVLAGMLISLVVAAAFGAVNRDLNLTRHDLDHKQAYEAARAGLADYAYHLNSDTNYWAKCEEVPGKDTGQSAVNQVGSTARKRPVPGSTGAEYAIELLPAESGGYSVCDTANAVDSMIETSGPSTGTFRVRSTGFVGDSKQSIVATFKRSGFLDFLYFTELETSDPVTKRDEDEPPNGNEDEVQWASENCSITVAEGRPPACGAIYFIDGEEINGPLHTNDRLAIDGQPTFGRTPTDSIEVSSPPPGWEGDDSASPNFVGTFVTNAPVLTPPPTNQELADVAEPEYSFTGQAFIELNGQSMTITTLQGQETLPIPDSGVLYVANGACDAAYSPFASYFDLYPLNSTCGNVYVSGDYSERLTIAAENDIIVYDDITRTSDDAMLGLIANNFIRVYNPCFGGQAYGPYNLQIDAAMLAIQHSFIVDQYNCGNSRGTLNVDGAIAQKYRGPVGTFGGGGTVTGYSKNYNYDDRLRYITPPHFLDPVESAWGVQRETLDYP